MEKLDFSAEELLEQARSNQTAFWHLALAWTRQRDWTVDTWAGFVGRHFARSWDEMGDDPSALQVARTAALNVATTADMRPVKLSGDDSRAELVIEGPDEEWLNDFGTTLDDTDRANEMIFRAIAERRGLKLEARRDEAGLHLIFMRGLS